MQEIYFFPFKGESAHHFCLMKLNRTEYKLDWFFNYFIGTLPFNVFFWFSTFRCDNISNFWTFNKISLKLLFGPAIHYLFIENGKTYVLLMLWYYDVIYFHKFFMIIQYTNIWYQNRIFVPYCFSSHSFNTNEIVMRK